MVDNILNTIVATCVASFLIYYLKSSGLFRYTLEVLERALSRKEFPLYECLGGIIVPMADPNRQQVDMDHVPDVLYQRALNMARTQVAQGVFPRFDLKVMEKKYLYWVHAGMEGRVHVLSFYRRPRMFVLH